MLWSSVVPWKKKLIVQGIPGILQHLAIWQWISETGEEGRDGVPPNASLEYEIHLLKASGPILGEVRAVRAEGWDTGECVFFERGTMSKTEITEMNVNVLYTCMCTYVLLYIILFYMYSIY